MGISIVSRQTWNAPHFANVVEPAIGRRQELWYVDMYLGMLNDTEKARNAAVIVKLNMAAIWTRTKWRYKKPM